MADPRYCQWTGKLSFAWKVSLADLVKQEPVPPTTKHTTMYKLYGGDHLCHYCMEMKTDPPYCIKCGWWICHDCSPKHQRCPGGLTQPAPVIECTADLQTGKWTYETSWDAQM